MTSGRTGTRPPAVMERPNPPLDSVLEALPDAVLVVDAARRIVRVNERAEALFGRARDALIGQDVDLLLPEEHRAAARAGRPAAPRGVLLELDAVRADGARLPIELLLSPLEDLQGPFTLAVVRDVAERRRAELERVRADQQAAVAELGQLALGGEPVATLFQMAAEALARVLGVDLVEVLELLPGRAQFAIRGSVGWDPAPFVPVPDTMVGLSLDSGEPVVVRDMAADPHQYAALLRDHHGVISGLAVPMIARGRELGAIGVHARRDRAFTEDDVHFVQAVANVVASAMERAEAEAALHATSARLQAVLDASPGALALKDAEGRITFANPSFEAIFGLPSGGAVGLTAADLAEPDDAAEITAHDRQVMAGGHPVEIERWFRVRGRERRFVVAKFPLLDRTGDVYGLGTLATDITERSELEARLARSERLEAVGQLAGGIAHDFNNLLAVIANYAAFVDEKIDPGSQAAEDVEQILAACRRAGELTRRLLLFSRRRSGNPEVVDLAHAIGETERLLRRTLGEQIELRTRVAGSLARVEADRGQLEQVLLNLAINARDAMPGGGELVIAADNAIVAGEPMVRLTVRDTGCGMDQEVLDRAFEPFFTTKEVGEGTGLGLATVYGIVRGARGQIELSSASGSGTTVTVHLPAAVGAPVPEADVDVPREPQPGHGEMVLVVEDKAAVRELTSRILRDGGYHTRGATDGLDALDALESLGEIDVLVTDVVMPGLDGRGLADELRRRRPGLPVVFVSGYTEDYVVESAREDGATAFVEKPFAGAELLEAVRRVLDEAAAG
jgi:two-component system, cell cycle sensor histidine kinase and response regulator CckA